MTDMQKKETARVVLEQYSWYTTKISMLKDTASDLTRRNEFLLHKGVRLSARTQQHYREIMNELQRMIDQYERNRQSIIAVIESITESTKFERGCRECLMMRYVEDMTQEQMLERMGISHEHLMRKRGRALLLFYDAMKAAKPAGIELPADDED